MSTSWTVHLIVPILFQVPERFIDEEDYELPAFLDENDHPEDAPSLRLLDRFKIYDANRGVDALVPFSKVEEVLASPGTMNTTYKAQGLASSFFDSDAIQEQPDVPDGQSPGPRMSVAINLGSIISTRVDWLHGILIQTSKATYCLQCPKEEYLPMYEKSWIRHRLGILVTNAIQRPEIVSLSENFLNSLPEEEGEFEGVALRARDVIGRALHLDDFGREVGKIERGFTHLINPAARAHHPAS